jgi:tRNA threonylcarbamoyladenosine biosynthesis protein TsaB
MLILTIRTDKPEAELGVYDGQKKLAYQKWQAHGELSVTFYSKLEGILNELSIKLEQVEGFVVYKGPGSFTGLRIGVAAANALAYGLDAKIVSANGKNWIDDGIRKLEAGQNEKIALPEYGAPPRVTQPKK